MTSLKAFFTLLSFSLLFSCFSLDMPQAEEISFLYMTQAGYQPVELLEMANRFKSKTGHKVKIFFPEYEDRYSLIEEAVKNDDTQQYDIILLDHIWLKNFIKRDFIRIPPQQLRKKVRTGIVPEIYSAFEDENTIWAVPFHADFQLLFVNQRILNRAGYEHPPQSLEELVQMAKKAKELDLVKYPIFDAWGPYESLVCEYTWILAAFGGQFRKDDKLTLDTEAGHDALSFMKRLIDEKLINPYSLHSKERFVNEVFCAGDALFVTNWTFLLEFAKRKESDVKENWKPALIPVSKKVDIEADSMSICGFEGLAVMKEAQHPQIAWDFVEFLTKEDFQMAHNEYLTVWKQLWEKSAFRQRDPHFKLKLKQLMNIAYRPSLAGYFQFSEIIQSFIHAALQGTISVDEALSEAQAQVESIR